MRQTDGERRLKPEANRDLIDIDALSCEEKLDLLDRLWDCLNSTKDELPVPEWQIALAEERLADYRRDPTRARSAFDVLDELERDGDLGAPAEDALGRLGGREE